MAATNLRTPSLRSRLESKARRRVVVPIPITDPGDAARQAAEQAEMALAYGRLTGAKGTALAALETAYKAAQAVLDEHMVDIELQAMPSAEWEALTVTHLLPSGDDLDWRALLPEALAGSAVDETLRDPDWWKARLDDPAWSAGDVAALRRAVIAVNQWAPAAHLPKG